jgi:hypothetical protein
MTVDTSTITYKGRTVPFDQAEDLIREGVQDAMFGADIKRDAHLEQLAREAWGAGFKRIDPIARTVTLDMDKAGEMAREFLHGPGAHLRALEKAMEILVRKVRDLRPGDEYPAPIGRFGGLDFLPAPDLAWIAQGLIATCEEFSHLRDQKVVFCWKKKGGSKAGKLTLGTANKVSGLAAHFAETIWVVWLAADNVAVFALTRLQVEAALYHELLHLGEEEDDDGNKKPAVYAHDTEMFAKEVMRYGCWKEDLELAREAFTQLPLFGPEAEPASRLCRCGHRHDRHWAYANGMEGKDRGDECMAGDCECAGYSAAPTGR